VGKPSNSFDFDVVPSGQQSAGMAIHLSDRWLDKGANLLLFGPPAEQEPSSRYAIGLALVENGWRVCIMRTTISLTPADRASRARPRKCDRQARPSIIC